MKWNDYEMINQSFHRALSLDGPLVQIDKTQGKMQNCNVNFHYWSIYKLFFDWLIDWLVLVNCVKCPSWGPRAQDDILKGLVLSDQHSKKCKDIYFTSQDKLNQNALTVFYYYYSFIKLFPAFFFRLTYRCNWNTNCRKHKQQCSKMTTKLWWWDWSLFKSSSNLNLKGSVLSSVGMKFHILIPRTK